uniref:Uncharacterized protein n=1 Tax=Solanum lycopersicum TaxID=4081 RepID=A0A494G9L0_SOLLC
MSDTRKLSPMHQSLLNRGRIPSGTSGTTGTGTSTSTNASQVSIAASSQYPGEDNDAFHVRSTYARLEAEGVHGDGWDPGVERTRGGPQMSNKRSTVFEASKEGNVGAAEREYLSNLDRYGFVNEPLRNRSETRLALIPTAPLLKIPKLPKTSPIPAGHTEAPPPGPAFGAMAEGPSPRAPDTPKHSNREAEMHKRKETERVDKWMAMMSVKKRDQGGNIAEWGWRKDAQGQKVRRDGSDVG